MKALLFSPSIFSSRDCNITYRRLCDTDSSLYMISRILNKRGLAGHFPWSIKFPSTDSKRFIAIISLIEARPGCCFQSTSHKIRLCGRVIRVSHIFGGLWDVVDKLVGLIEKMSWVGREDE